MPDDHEVTHQVHDLDRRLRATEDGLVRVESAVSSLAGSVGTVLDELKNIRKDFSTSQRPNWGWIMTACGTLLSVIVVCGTVIWFGVSARLDGVMTRLSGLEATAERRTQVIYDFERHRGVMEERTRWIEKLFTGANTPNGTLAKP